MNDTSEIWPYVIALAAVINGLGIVRLIGSFGEFLKSHSTLDIKHYWVYTLLVIFQIFGHLLLWWSIIGLVSIGSINFLSYLYLLIGPTLLYLATCIIAPEVKDKTIDLRIEYYKFRKMYFSLLTVFWCWGIFAWPAFGHGFAPTVPLLLVWLFISLILRFTDNHKAHAALITANCIIYVFFVTKYAMELGGVGRSIVEGG